MELLKIFSLTAVVQLTCIGAANGAIVLSKDVRSTATWDNAFTVTTMGFGAHTNSIDVNDNDTVGKGQSFTSTATGNVDRLSLGVLRMYANLEGVVNVYRMFDGDGASPGANPSRFRNGNPDWMSDAIATIAFDTNTVNINNSSDGNDMFTFGLSGADQFTVEAGATYMVSVEGVGANPGTGDLLLWHRNDSNPYADGRYGIPDDGTTAAGRDVMLAINITAVPEPSSLCFLGLGLVGLATRRRR